MIVLIWICFEILQLIGSHFNSQKSTWELSHQIYMLAMARLVDWGSRIPAEALNPWSVQSLQQEALFFRLK